MKRVIKRAVSFVLVFMTVFSVFTILPSEVFHTAYVKAAEMFSSETGASAQETYTTDDFTYTLIDEYSKVQILSYIGSDTDVVIPDRIDNKKVTSIADSAFREKSITSVVFGQYVESIGNYAFYSCQSLNKLDFSKSSVKTIGDYAFAINKVLESVEFPDTIESIGNNAFITYTDDYSSYVENKLKSVKFGKGLKTIGDNAFDYNRKLTNIVFTGKNTTSIGAGAFAHCSKITEFTLSGNNVSISNSAFSQNYALEEVTLSGVKTIGKYVFYDCRALNKVNLGDDLNSLGDYAFDDCTSLESINLPESLTTINANVFKSCTKLNSIEIPNNVTKLNDNTFFNCSSLKDILIGSGCTSISSTAFFGASSIDRITVSEDNKNFTAVDGVLYNKDMTTLVLYPKNCSGEFAVPDTVTTIADYAFYNSPNITKVTSGANVKTIGARAFQNCNSLATVIFEDSDTIKKTIGDYAFYNCPALSKVDFGNAVKSIGNHSFAVNKSIESIEFPDSLESIGDNAFTTYTDDYRNSYVENKLKSVKFGKGLKTIGYRAFYCNRKLTNIVFTGENLTSIGSNAFRCCYSLTELNLKGNGETVIGYCAFYGNDALKKISLTGIKTINYGAFENCGDLNSVNFGEGLLSIGSYAFRNCPNI